MTDVTRKGGQVIALVVACLFLMLAVPACGGGGDDADLTVQAAQGTPCLRSDQCGEGRYCLTGRCVEGTFTPDQTGTDNGSGGTDNGGDGSGSGGDETQSCDCTGSQVCDTVDYSCSERDICVNDFDCTGTRSCVKGACQDTAAECRTTSECEAGSTCYAPDGVCELETCTSDSDCSNTRVCHNGVCGTCNDSGGCGDSNGKTCVDALCEEPEPCTADADCNFGRSCVDCGGINCCELTCPSDALEPNDVEDETTPSFPDLTTGTHTPFLCVGDGDIDNFYVKRGTAEAATALQPGDGVLARIAWDPSFGSPSIALYAEDSPASTADDLGGVGVVRIGHVAAIASDPGIAKPVRLELSTAGLDEGTALTVELEVVEGGFCLEDDLEPNDTITTPANFGIDPAPKGLAATLCDDDEDWFIFNVTANKQLTITLDTQYGTPPGVELFTGAAGATSTDTLTRVARETTNQTNRTLQQSVTTATNFYLRVFRVTGATEADMDIQVTTGAL